MDLKTKKNIVEAANGYIENHGMTQSSTSTITTIPEAHLSNMLNGIFTYSAGKDKVGDIPIKYFYMLADLVDYEYEKKIWKIITTPQMLQTFEVLQDARDNAATRVIIGETGCGKSLVLSLFKKKHPTDVFSVVVGSEDNLNDLLNKVCRTLRVPIRGSKSSKIREISRALEFCKHGGGKPILVFDECEYMKTAALCSIKEFYDYLHKVCSITLIGTEQLKDSIERLKKRDAKGIPQLYRRIKFGFRTLRPINRNYTDFLTEINDKKLKVWLQHECTNYGELHDVLVPCMKEAERMNVPLTLPLVKMVLGLQNFDTDAA